MVSGGTVVFLGERYLDLKSPLVCFPGMTNLFLVAETIPPAEPLVFLEGRVVALAWGKNNVSPSSIVEILE